MHVFVNEPVVRGMNTDEECGERVAGTSSAGIRFRVRNYERCEGTEDGLGSHS